MTGTGAVQLFIPETLSWLSATVWSLDQGGYCDLLSDPLTTEHCYNVIPPFSTCFSSVVHLQPWWVCSDVFNKHICVGTKTLFNKVTTI